MANITEEILRLRYETTGKAEIQQAQRDLDIVEGRVESLTRQFQTGAIGMDQYNRSLGEMSKRAASNIGVIQQWEKATGQATMGGRQMGMMAYQLGQVFEDMQYSLAGGINNLTFMAQTFLSGARNAGLWIGAISIGAAALTYFLRKVDMGGKEVAIATSAIDTMTRSLEELEKKKDISIEVKLKTERLKEELDALKRLVQEGTQAIIAPGPTQVQASANVNAILKNPALRDMTTQLFQANQGRAAEMSPAVQQARQARSDYEKQLLAEGRPSPAGMNVDVDARRAELEGKIQEAIAGAQKAEKDRIATLVASAKTGDPTAVERLAREVDRINPGMAEELRMAAKGSPKPEDAPDRYQGAPSLTAIRGRDMQTRQRAELLDRRERERVRFESDLMQQGRQNLLDAGEEAINDSPGLRARVGRTARLGMLTGQGGQAKADAVAEIMGALADTLTPDDARPIAEKLYEDILKAQQHEVANLQADPENLRQARMGLMRNQLSMLSLQESLFQGPRTMDAGSFARNVQDTQSPLRKQIELAQKQLTAQELTAENTRLLERIALLQ